MESRKLLGFAIGVFLFLAMLFLGTYAFYSWKSGNTDVTFNIGDSYFYCETGQNVSETGLAPVLDYQSTTSKYSFKVNNIGKSDTKFSVTLNISEISETLKSTSLKYKLMVDKTGSSTTCDTSSNCTEVTSGDFSKMKKGINTIAPSIDLPNNSRYQYYLFIYIDGNMQNDTSMQNGTLKMAIEVCDIIVTLDYNGGNVVDNKEYIKVASLYTGLPDSVSRNTSNVTYDTAGGSSVSNDSVSYSFGGWYLENDFKNKVTASTEVKSTINHTLYAKWNSSKVITLPTTAKNGYTFKGWYNGSSYVGAAGDSYNPSTSVSLTAHWTANNYTVTLDNQGATSAGTTSVNATYDKAMPTITIPSKNYKVTYNYNENGQNTNTVTFNYSFGGYFTEKGGAGTQYYKTDGSSAKNYNISSNKTLYAKWTSTPITLPTPTRTGYTFNGWYNESGIKIASGGETYTPTADITLIAHWTANIYKITLDNQGATNSGTQEVYYQYNTTKTVNGITCYYYTDSSLSSCLSSGYNITSPSKTGYSFGGYYTSTNGGGTNYINSSGTFINNIYQTAQNRTLYAKWTLSQFQVTYDYSTNGGTAATKTTAMVNYGASIDLTPTATKSGWTFIGWNTNKDATTKLSSLTMGTTPITLYALYKKTGQVTFNLNGNAGFTYNSTKYTATTAIDLCTMYNRATTCTASVTMPTITASSNTPTIIGWSNASGTHSATYTSGQTNVTLTSGTTWYAQTQKTSVQGKVTFNPNGNTAFTYGGTKYTSTTTINLCTIGATYNGTAQGSTCTASVTMPTITASSNTPTIIGWSNASGTHSVTYTSGQTNVTLTSGTTWYAQTQKTSVQGKVTFNPNGNSAFTYGGTKYTSTTTINLCTIGATYNGTAQGSTCTASVTMPTVTASSNTPTIIGWSNASGTHSATYTSGQTNVTLTSGTTWYAQTQKTSVQGKVTFNPNGNSAFTYGGTKYTATTTINLCTIGATYNGTAQDSTCTASVTMPTITASSNTPTIIGWSNASGTHSATYTSGQTNVTLTSGTTWYAQTQNTAVQGKVTFNPNGNTAFTYGGTKYTTTTSINLCTIGATYNGTAQGSTCTASVTMPTITASSNTPTIIGWSNASGTHSATYTSGQTGVTLTSGTTWYAQTQKTSVQGKVTFNPNGNTAFTYGGTKYTATTSINLCTIGATYNGTAQGSICTASVTMPTITASSNTPTIIGWSNASGTHSATYTSGQTGVTLTSGTTWYAQTQKTAVTLSANFNANGATLSSTASQSCILGAVYNGSSQTTSCTVTLPNATKSGYKFLGWYSDSNYNIKIGNAGDTYTISSNVSLYGRLGKISTVTLRTINNLMSSSDYTSSNKISLTGSNSDTYQYYDNIVVYLEAGREYYAYGESDGTWSTAHPTGGNSTAVGFWVYNADHAAHYLVPVNTGSFKVDYTGMYKLRLNVYQNGVTHQFWNFGVRPVDTTIQVVEGEKYSSLPSSVSLPGYDFTGWYTGSVTGDKVTNDTDVTIASDHTLYARWNGKSVKVTYDANDNMFSTTTRTVGSLSITYEEKYDGNYLTLNGTYTDSTSLMDYLIVFPEGKNVITTLTYVSGSYVEGSPSRWVSEIVDSNGSNLSTRNNADVVMPTESSPTSIESFTTSSLAASSGRYLRVWLWSYTSGTWVFNNYKIKVDIRVSDTLTTTLEQKTGDNYSLPTSNPTRIGYDFDGWYSDANGGAAITSSSVISVPVDHKVYAHWKKKNNITVNFTKQYFSSNDSLSADSVTVPYGTTYYLSNNKLVFSNGQTVSVNYPGVSSGSCTLKSIDWGSSSGMVTSSQSISVAINATCSLEKVNVSLSKSSVRYGETLGTITVSSTLSSSSTSYVSEISIFDSNRRYYRCSSSKCTKRVWSSSSTTANLPFRGTKVTFSDPIYSLITFKSVKKTLSGYNSNANGWGIVQNKSLTYHLANNNEASAMGLISGKVCYVSTNSSTNSSYCVSYTSGVTRTLKYNNNVGTVYFGNPTAGSDSLSAWTYTLSNDISKFSSSYSLLYAYALYNGNLSRSDYATLYDFGTLGS